MNTSKAGAKAQAAYMLAKHLTKSGALPRAPAGLVWKPEEFRAWVDVNVPAANAEMRKRAQA